MTETLYEIAVDTIKKKKLVGLDNEHLPVCALEAMEGFAERRISRQNVIEYLTLLNDLMLGRRESGGEDVIDLTARISRSLGIRMEDYRVDRQPELNELLGRVERGQGMVIERPNDHLDRVVSTNKRNRYSLVGIGVEDETREYTAEKMFRDILYRKGTGPNVTMMIKERE